MPDISIKPKRIYANIKGMTPLLTATQTKLSTTLINVLLFLPSRYMLKQMEVQIEYKLISCLSEANY